MRGSFYRTYRQLEQTRNLKRFCFWRVWGASRQQLEGSRDRSSRSLICIGRMLSEQFKNHKKNTLKTMEIDWTIPNIWGTSASPWARRVYKMWTRSVFAISLSEFNQQHIAIGIMYELQNNMEFAIIIRKLVGIVESCGESLNSPSITLTHQRSPDFLLGLKANLNTSREKLLCVAW